MFGCIWLSDKFSITFVWGISVVSLLEVSLMRKIYFHCGSVLADGHVPWACEAFSKLHGQELVSSPALFWYCCINFHNHWYI